MDNNYNSLKERFLLPITYNLTKKTLDLENIIAKLEEPKKSIATKDFRYMEKRIKKDCKKIVFEDLIKSLAESTIIMESYMLVNYEFFKNKKNNYTSFKQIIENSDKQPQARLIAIALVPLSHLQQGSSRK